VRYERQLVLREWGTAGQAALEAAHAELPCEGEAFAVAARYLQAAGVSHVSAVARASSSVPVASPEASPKASFVAAMGALPWHADSAREVGIGAAHAVEFLATTLREVPR
jgi:hypothetical protein